MENAIWNGKVYIASEIAASYELEKNIRKASGRKELLCPDPDCPSPVLRYCHGEIKCAFFAHLDNCTCDYAEFDRENTQLMRQVKRTLYDSFISRGFDVQMEVKLLPRHYTHLLFTLPGERKIAVELGTQRTTANRIDYLSEQYAGIGIETKWIVMSDAHTPVKEKDTYFMKRYLLNESKRKDILILNWDGTEITQYIVDPNEYSYKGCRILLENYPEIYSESGTLQDLTFDAGELTIAHFHERYHAWLIEKENAFKERIAQIEREDKQKEKRMQALRAQFERLERERKARDAASHRGFYAQDSRVASARATETAPMTYEARRESILPLMEHQTELALDATGARWLRCEKCGAVETVDFFQEYGGPNRVRGICYKCYKR